MCGIAAFFSSDKRISAERLKRATNTLHHRGPDSQGAWLSPNQRVGLGHARLSIIDLTTGDQPIANEDERIHIVVNGEFYDFERQRRELERRGHLFRTRSDSEIALHLYEEFGAHCVQQLRGEFAFVLWDEANQTLFAARDRFGIKPLYYAVHDDTLYLASEIKALFAAGVPARWDHESFYQHATGPAMSDRTLFDGVHQVPPGHYLTATTNGMRILRYWEFNYPPADELGADTRDESAFVEEFAAVFEEAVRLRMRADVPVGCYLSGGLDSCAVLGFAARLSSSPIQAFTLTFDQAAYDEGDIAREMAARAGANFHPIPIKQSDIADNFADAIWHSETLFSNGHGVSKYLLSRAVRDAGYKVVYTGEGSDEIFGGYVHFRSDMLQHNTQGQDAAEVQRLLQRTRNREQRLARDAHARRQNRIAGERRAVARLCARLLEGVRGAGPATADPLRRRLQSTICGTRQRPLVSGQPGRTRRLEGSRSPQQVTVRLGEIVFAQLHPQSARRPDGNGALGRRPRAIPGSSRRRVRLSRAGVVENPRRDREIFAPRSGQAGDHRDRVPPAKASVSLAAGDHGSDGTVPSNDAGHTARSRPRVATVLRSEESRRPARPTARDVGFGPYGWDPALMSVLSACVIQERFGLGSMAAGNDTLG